MKRRDFLRRSSAVAVTAGAGAAMMPAPAISQNRKRWRLAMTWPNKAPGLATGAKVVADYVEKASNGRLTIEVFGAGEIVPAFEVLSAVSNGTIEMGHGYPSYWSGVNPAMNFLAPLPFTLTPQEQYAWFRFGGGNELAEELYAQHGLKFFVSGNVAAQGHGWFNREINSIDDYKGLKMRIGGLGGRILSEAGATVVSIPLGEVLQSLQTGAIDAAEFVGPLNDLAFGLYRAASNYYWPGWQEPSGIMDCFVNRDSWDSLDGDLQEIVAGANAIANEYVLSEYIALNAKSLRTLTQEHGVEVKRLNDDTLKELASLSKGVIEAEADKDPMSRKMLDSIRDFRNLVMPYTDVAEKEFMAARRFAV